MSCNAPHTLAPTRHAQHSLVAGKHANPGVGKGDGRARSRVRKRRRKGGDAVAEHGAFLSVERPPGEGFLNRMMGGEKTVWRGGFQVSYDTWFNNLLSNIAGSSPNTLGGNIGSTTVGELIMLRLRRVAVASDNSQN